MGVVGAIFVDGASISMSLKQAGAIPVSSGRIDYSRLLSVLRTTLCPPALIDFRYMCYYTSYRDTEITSPRPGRMAFKNKLIEAGWSVFERQAKSYPDGHYEDKGLDLALALDCFQMFGSDIVNVIVVATHDADFAELLRRVPASKKKFVLGWRFCMAKELSIAATPVFLENIISRVKYE